jgi:hypothetical protein
VLLGVGLVLLFYARCVANIAATGYNKHTGYRVKEGVFMSVKVNIIVPAGNKPLKTSRKYNLSAVRQLKVRAKHVNAHRTYAEEMKRASIYLKKDIENLRNMSKEEAKAFSFDRLKKFGFIDDAGKLRYPYDQ